MTKTCCFFGHREVTHNIRGRLTAIIEKLITENGVTNFYVGNQGQFDSMVYSVLKELKVKYPHIRYPLSSLICLIHISKKCTVKILFSLMIWRVFRRNMLSAKETIG